LRSRESHRPGRGAPASAPVARESSRAGPRDDCFAGRADRVDLGRVAIASAVVLASPDRSANAGRPCMWRMSGPLPRGISVLPLYRKGFRGGRCSRGCGCPEAVHPTCSCSDGWKPAVSCWSSTSAVAFCGPPGGSGWRQSAGRCLRAEPIPPSDWCDLRLATSEANGAGARQSSFDSSWCPQCYKRSDRRPR